MLLYINWDGFSYHWYERARQDGGTPNLDRLIANGAVLRNHHCGIPAITNPMQQTLVSGAWPEKTGNCYVYIDRALRRAVPTGRKNLCENICEAALRQGLSCASVHGWYFENRGCVPGDEARPYIQNNLPNFETRVQLLLDYLAQKPVPSGDGVVTMSKRPDFLAIYADDIDNVCHNGARLPYPDLRRATTLDEWYGNLALTVRRMDKALGRLMDIADVTLALAADHGGMPFATAMNGVDEADAKTPKAPQLIDAIRRAGVDAYPLQSAEDTAPRDAEALLLVMGTQALLTYLQAPDDATRQAVVREISALPFVHRCLHKDALRKAGAWEDFCDVYVTTRAPYFLNGKPSEYVGGSHAATEDSVTHVFCAFCGEGVKQGVVVDTPTDLTDFAPTLAALLRIAPPRDATGRVLTEILL